MGASPKPKTDSSSLPSLGKAIVLGTAHGLTNRIAQQLAIEGFDPVIPGLSDDLLPGLSDPDATRKMREILEPYRGCVLHPGVSTWAERPELVAVGQKAGMHVIAPSSRVLTLFWNKLNLFERAEEVGIPNLVIESEPMHTLREIESFIRSYKQGFPFILKTAKGGSRVALTVVHSTEEIETKLPLWIDQVRENSGEVLLFAESYLDGSRFISVPFARFASGRVQTFPIVDASLQCRHRKIIEFSPAQGLDPGVEKRVMDWTLSIAHLCGYVGVGTLEYLIDSDRAYLIGGTPRLSAAFHLWEMAAGTRAVSWQVAAARDSSIMPPIGARDQKWGAGVALRLYAEDSILQLPQPGIAREVDFNPDGMAETEVDLALEPGSELKSTQSGWIGTIWSGGDDRASALESARKALSQLWIAGSLQTNERFLFELLSHPWIREGIFHTGFVDEEFLPALRPLPEQFKILASILESCGLRPEAPGRWAIGDQWVKPDPALVQWVSPPEKWLMGELCGVSGRIRSDGVLRVCAYPLDTAKWLIRMGPWVMLARWVSNQAKGRPFIASLVKGRMHSLLFREGSHVPAHEPLAIVESLGMLVPHALPVEVAILRWKVSPEQEVSAGQNLAEFEILNKT